ncbi:MAG: hypothetical protein HETSPECPRED_000737 [Heterodermia speciosa]|uniref:C2H2-type domain-containing protein n=1 Tax=Heterodermia speciosa TaxID=116794 RepID=A0A8H3IRV4_9LECA|nr:MAG: hypothetical protein HETSPECPRED_000737 [Heterodermia speciosa]
MASNSNSREKHGRTSSTTALMTFNTYMTDDNHWQQNPSVFANRNEHFNIPTGGRENFHSTSIHPIYGLGAIPEQASPTSPFMPPLPSANPTANGVGDQIFDLDAFLASASYQSSNDTFDPNVNIAVPSYRVGSHTNYGFNSPANTGYGHSNGGPYQSIPPPDPVPTLIPRQTSTTSSNRFSCPTCGKTFTRKADMQRHKRLHGKPSLQCNVQGCTKGFYRNDKLQEHIKTHQRN